MKPHGRKNVSSTFIREDTDTKNRNRCPNKTNLELTISLSALQHPRLAVYSQEQEDH